jgi:signal transduction histidine kinase
VKLSFKLVLAFLVVGLIGVAIVALLASMTTENAFARFIFDEYRQASVEQLTNYYKAHADWNGVSVFAPVPGPVPFERHSHGGRRWAAITLVDEDGVVILPGIGSHHGEKMPKQALADALPIEVDGETVGWVLATREAFPESPAEAQFVQRINRTLIASALGAGAISLLLGVFLARTITHPIRELTAATRALAEGDLHQEVPVRTRDELGELTRSFNQMSADLARSTELRRQMTADIAHELRTPISVILGHVDALDEGVLPFNDETFNIIREETLRLERLVEDLHTLSRADSGELTLIRRQIRPGELLRRALAANRLSARDKEIDIHIEVQNDLRKIEVDPDRLGQVFGNLIRNALRYTAPGGEIHLSASAIEGGIEFRVMDSGSGIDPEALPHIFDRFYRSDASRQRDTGGSGLGLAIARSLVEAHGGRIWAESRRDEGTTFIIQIPSI